MRGEPRMNPPARKATDGRSANKREFLIPSNSTGIESRNREEFEAVKCGECATIGEEWF